MIGSILLFLVWCSAHGAPRAQPLVKVGARAPRSLWSRRPWALGYTCTLWTPSGYDNFSCRASCFMVRLRVMQRTIFSRPLCPSVCPSVKRVDCDKTKETCAHILIPHKRPFILVFWQEEWLVGRPLLPEILGQTDPVGAKTPISIDIHSYRFSRNT